MPNLTTVRQSTALCTADVLQNKWPFQITRRSR